jgi:hypothetical protein
MKLEAWLRARHFENLLSGEGMMTPGKKLLKMSYVRSLSSQMMKTVKTSPTRCGNTQCTASFGLTLSSVNLQQVEVMPTNYANRAPVNGRETHDFSEDEAPQGFRYVSQLERRRAVMDQSRMQRSNRYDAWDRAREQFRANPGLDSENALHDQGTNAREIVEFERPYRSSVVAPPRPIQVSPFGSLRSNV